MPGTSLCRNSACRPLSSGHTPMKIGTLRCAVRLATISTSAGSNTGWVITYCAPAAILRSRRAICASRNFAFGLNVQPITNRVGVLTDLPDVVEPLVDAV